MKEKMSNSQWKIREAIVEMLLCLFRYSLQPRLCLNNVFQHSVPSINVIIHTKVVVKTINIFSTFYCGISQPITAFQMRQLAALCWALT